MPSEASSTGQLIALDGPSGRDLMAAARRLVRQIGEKHAGISEWGASNLFAELKLGDASMAGPSPRMLILLYATDLAFRLRWEIRPALEEGRTVVAVPYVQTALAFGKATGLSRRWLVELLSFADRPSVCYRVKERKDAPAPGRSSEGFLKFCGRALNASGPAWDMDAIRKGFDYWLDALERRRGCEALTEKLLASAGSGR